MRARVCWLEWIVHPMSGSPLVWNGPETSTNILTLICVVPPLATLRKGGITWYHPRSIQLWYVKVFHPEKSMYKQVDFSNVARTHEIIKVSILWSWERRFLRVCIHIIYIYSICIIEQLFTYVRMRNRTGSHWTHSFRFLWPCIVSKVWRQKNQQDATIRCSLLTSVSTCFGHHYVHLQENKGSVTAFVVLFWFCWMWLVAVVGCCVVGCDH